MRCILILTIILAATWLGLSGYFRPFLLSLGAISLFIVIWMCARMRILDAETVPYLAAPRAAVYFRWLFKEIVKANLHVVKSVLDPKLQICPALIRVKATQKTDMGRTVFANSITLTPGTVSLDFEGEDIIVHALLDCMSDPNDFTDMDQRAGWMVERHDNVGLEAKTL